MNLSFVTSFTIGGLLLLSIIALNNTLMLHSMETTVDVMTEYKHDAMFDMITQDFSRIGYGFPTGTQTIGIKQFEDDRITFTADVLDNGVHDITWKFEGIDASTTKNPNDKILVRTGTFGSGSPSDTEMTYYVIDFKLTGYRDVYGKQETSNAGEVKSVLVQIVYESEDVPSNMSNSSQSDYQRKYWRKLIVPKNLQYAK